jgi:hypothetical protein
MNLKKNVSHITIMFLLMAAISCNRTGKDYSIGNDEYKKLGMPDYNKKWNSDDYSEAIITLGTLHEKTPLTLPRKLSKKSGEVFKRIVNEENLSFATDTAIPLKIRAYMIQHYPRMIGEIEYLYSFEEEGKMVYREEFIGILKFNLVIYDIMLDLSKIIDKSDDESLSGFKDGKNMVRGFYLKYISSMTDKVSKPELQSAEGFEELTGTICKSVNLNSDWMTDQNKVDVAIVLRRLAEKTRSKAVKDNLLSSVNLLTR